MSYQVYHASKKVVSRYKVDRLDMKSTGWNIFFLLRGEKDERFKRLDELVLEIRQRGIEAEVDHQTYDVLDGYTIEPFGRPDRDSYQRYMDENLDVLRKKVERWRKAISKKKGSKVKEKDEF